MTLWVAYVPQHMEFDLVEACEALGVAATAPRLAECVRTGKNRWPEPRVTPYLPNYVFLDLTPEEWHWMLDIRYVRDLMGVGPNEEAKVREFIDAAEMQFAAKMAEIESAQRIMRDREASKAARREALKIMQAYQPKDLLEVICGPFAGQIAEFGRMVESANAMLPHLEVSIQGVNWGTVKLDPLAVKKLAG